MRIPLVLPAIPEFRSPDKTRDEHDPCAAERPLIVADIPLKEERRLLFLQHLVRATDRRNEVDMILAGAAVLRRIAPLLDRPAIIIIEGTEIDIALLIRRGKEFERVFHEDTLLLPLGLVIGRVQAMHTKTYTHEASVTVLHPARRVDLTGVHAQLK